MNLGPLKVGARIRRKKDFDLFMYVIAFIQPFALVPQIFNIYIAHDTTGVSFATWALFTSFNALWAVYGIVHRDKPLILAYILIAFFDAIIAIGVL